MPTEGGKATDKAVGRSRGGLNTKLHVIVDGLGALVEFMLSAGNDHDAIHAVELLEKIEISGSNVLADRAYGAKARKEAASLSYLVAILRNHLSFWKKHSTK